ncbi:hypothetical protein [Hymenobacter properus]|uniref:Uncharacterized protein n=1 Tax=Hymenobacter properus TaxID=2791026 RepID=A0A931FJ44_9BACT|nr:hypothetical protein [Hymenobacter properus]MBF9142632.1 hypothetical protein [Hymenobacter properus]MBR7721440.1 hypothetical protein [Microvirga sp. SRT04]
MKHFLLLLALLGAAGAASAQANLIHAISLGTRLGVDAAVAGNRKHQDASSDRYVTTATYHGASYYQKRTPSSKLKGPGGPQIAYQESLLQQCQAALLADSTSALGTAETWAMLQSSRELIARDRPSWAVDAYADEASFYQAETVRRQRRAAAEKH